VIPKLDRRADLDLNRGRVHGDFTEGRLVGVYLENGNQGTVCFVKRGHLSQVKSLRRLGIQGTRVTVAGIEKPKRVLPPCQVVSGGLVPGNP
jgi:hypothetical protein